MESVAKNTPFIKKRKDTKSQSIYSSSSFHPNSPTEVYRMTRCLTLLLPILLLFSFFSTPVHADSYAKIIKVITTKVFLREFNFLFTKRSAMCIRCVLFIGTPIGYVGF